MEDVAENNKARIDDQSKAMQSVNVKLIRAYEKLVNETTKKYETAETREQARKVMMANGIKQILDKQQ